MGVNNEDEISDFVNLSDLEERGFISSEYLEPYNMEHMEFNDHDINMLHINIRGLNSEKDKLEELLKILADGGYHIDVILICETFLNDENKNMCDIEGYYFEFEYRKKLTRGGVGVYISKKLKYRKRDDLIFFIEGKIESCFIEIINNNGTNIVVGEVYRVPGTDENLLFENYKNLLDKLTKEKKEWLIGTDQNLDFMKINNHYGTNKLFDLLLSYGTYPVITKPTRITFNTATLIDNIYISEKLTIDYKTCILEFDISDHLPCLISIKNKILKNNSSKASYESRSLNNNNILNLKEELGKFDYLELETLDCQEAYDLFMSYFKKVYNDTCPVKVLVRSNKNKIKQPWMTKGLLISARKCNKLYRRSIGKEKTDINVINYNRYRNILNRIKTKNKINYYYSKIEMYRNDSKKLWKIYNTLLGKLNNKKETFEYLIKDNIKIYNDKQIADTFNNYFATVGIKLANKINKSRKNFNEYCKYTNDKSLFLMPTSFEEIEKIVNKFKNKTSYGIDEISNKLLKFIIRDISKPLEIIFNKSILEGKIPKEMKIAIVTPIYKAKRKTDPCNYRPVSLLTTFSKILEKIIYKRLYYFLEINDILYNSQYGFKRNLSTCDAITELIGSVLKNLDNKKFSLVVYLDLSKAFDTVDHNILLEKLYRYGIRGVSHNWFKNYLYEREQIVKINKDNKITLSDKSMVLTGVPQGSVLGPLLFLIYINDLNNSLEYMHSINFADDTNLVYSNSDIDELFIDVEYDLENTIDWFRANKLSVNMDKTCYMIFRPRGNKDEPILNRLRVGNNILKEVDSTKFLGVYIDNKLSWTKHVYHLKSKLHQCKYLLSKVKVLLPEKCCRLIYFAHGHSHLQNGIRIWGSMINDTQKNILNTELINCLNNITTKTINKVDIYKTLKILDLNQICELELLKLGFKYKHNELPENIIKLFPKQTNHRYKTRNKGIPLIGKHNVAITLNSFLTETNKIWTRSNKKIKNSLSLNVLTKNYKTSKFTGT